MGITTKFRKKLTRTLEELEKKSDATIKGIILQYVVILVLSLAFDLIANAVAIQYQPGIGYEQIGVAVICVVQIVRYWRML